VPKNKKKVVLEPAGKDLKQFQAKYGSVWKKIVDSPAFQAGVQFLRNRKLDSVANLTPDQIDKNSREILGDLRGFLQHEIQLGNLHAEIDFTQPFEEVDEYLSPEQVISEEKVREKYREQTKKERYA